MDIKTDKEYKKAKELNKKQFERLYQMQKYLEKRGMTQEEVKRVIDPIKCLAIGLKEEIIHYKLNNPNLST